MKKLTQKGFSVVEGLLIFVIVGILSFVGWYVYNQSQKQDETSRPQGGSVQLNEKSKESVHAEDEAVNHLEVSELGLMIILTHDIEDAYFVSADEFSGYLSTKSLDKYPNCKATSEDGVAAIASAKVGDDRFGSPWTKAELEKTGTLIDGRYYYIELGQYDCSADSKGENGYENFADIRKAFSEAKIEKLTN